MYTPLTTRRNSEYEHMQHFPGFAYINGEASTGWAMTVYRKLYLILIIINNNNNKTHHPPTPRRLYLYIVTPGLFLGIHFPNEHEAGIQCGMV